jgi:predicted nucleic acid-binding protein
MIVVDCNVIAYLLIQGEKTSLARSLWKRDNNWWMPTLWLHEFLNILATNERTGNLRLKTCHEILGLALSLFGTKSREVDTAYTLSLAAEHRVTAYDAQYIALAQSMNLLLVSEDRRLRQVAPQTAYSMKSFLGKTVETDR